RFSGMGPFCDAGTGPWIARLPTHRATEPERYKDMRKLLMLGVAVATLSAATPTVAEDAGLFVGGAAGGATGGTIGFLIGGPIGAVIGGWTGAAIGASVLSERGLDYIRHDRGGYVDIDTDIRVGTVVGGDVSLRPIR